MSADRKKPLIGMPELRAAAQAAVNEQVRPSPRYKYTMPGYGMAIEVLHAAGVMDRDDVKIGTDEPGKSS